MRRCSASARSRPLRLKFLNNTPTKAGYSQGQAGLLAGSQEIEPDVSSGQGEGLDNTNLIWPNILGHFSM